MPQREPPTVLLLTDAVHAGHAWPGHPERPERIAAVAAGVAEGALTVGAQLIQRPAAPVSVAEASAVHDPSYVAWLSGPAPTGGAFLDPDTYVVPGSWDAARTAAGLAVAAARAAASGAASVAFAAGRPPGHHAGQGGGKGFCLLNNVAIAAAALRSEDAARRVAVLDWDVHHGDGSEELFANDPATFYASTHQYPWYPGTGSAADQGETVLNVPLAAGTGDEDFVAAWREVILPRVEAFGAEVILVSAGYDAHVDDPLAWLEVTEDGFGTVARAVGEMARRLGLGGVALSLEGGYDLDALRTSAAATVSGLLTGLGSPGSGDSRD